MPAPERRAPRSVLRHLAASALARRRVGLGGVWALASLFYYWTATSSGDPILFGQGQADYYNDLTSGFLAGHLSILASPPKGLLALHNPYDPLANAAYSGVFHDLALYHGHFYLTWGPTPVLTLFLPWRLLHVGQLEQNLACLIFGAVGLAFALALLDAAVSWLVPQARPWKAVLGGLVLATAGLVPFLLRTPEIYQVSIAGAYCFTCASLWLLTKGLSGARRASWWLGFASLAAGLAAGAHWDMVLLGALLLGSLWYLHREAPVGRGGEARRALVVVGPFAAAVVLLLAYNVARFGSPLQFGASYQLAGYDPTKTPFYKLGYLWPSLYYYFVAPMRWTFAFPFFALAPPPAYPGAVPVTYVPEEIGGILTTTPLLLFLVVLAARRRLAPLLRNLCLVLVGLALVIAVLIAFSLPGGSMRYEADYATLFTLPALLVWMAWQPARLALRRALTALGAAFGLYGAVAQVALSTTGPVDWLRLTNPSTYSSLQHATSVLPTLVVMAEGHASVVRVIDPDAGYPTALGDYGTYQAGRSFTLLHDHEEIDVIAPHSGSYELTARYGRAETAPSGGRITVWVQDGTTIDHFRFRAGSHALAVPLVRGLNELEAWVTFTHPQAPGAFPDILTVENLAFSVPAPPATALRGR